MWPYGPLVRLCERLDLYLSLHLFDMLADGNALNFLIDNNFQLIIGLGVVMSLLTLAGFIGVIIICYVRRRQNLKEMSIPSFESKSK